MKYIEIDLTRASNSNNITIPIHAIASYYSVPGKVIDETFTRIEFCNKESHVVMESSVQIKAIIRKTIEESNKKENI